ncbi:LANO_0A02586g1_1 [Lachancea nothofagi CBS 11611]|uniref:Protein ROT1 n=1 Tax=Lachancea nothofagi CBS 11611 TaxID=1266666 RepID=A0A1G4IP79_9SACH|nr:LANO_0A02586g1_1 [Lachancea nothofagi CBS 11611]
MLQAISTLAILGLVARVLCDDLQDSLYGTWTSKSNQVFTGPDFYDPVEELLKEPSLPGISFSFTEDGYFEEAIYQVEGNPKDPGCPLAVIIYQHGKYDIQDNGTLTLTPFAVDGRQLLSQPCEDDGVSVYSRYNQTEVYKWFLVQENDYHGIQELQMYKADGSPMQPMYLAYRPPMMLPTETLNPTAASETSASNSKSKRSLRSLVRRSLENRHKTNAVKRSDSFVHSKIFKWASVGLIGVGSVIFLVS